MGQWLLVRTRCFVGWTSGGDEAWFCLSADQFAGNFLESSGAAVKRSRLEGRNGILMWKWTLEYLDRLWNHVETKEQQRQQQRKQQQHRNLRHDLTVMNLRCGHKECTQKHSGSELFWSEIGSTPGCRNARLPVQGSHTLDGS